jgi:hypothetical protein
MNEVQLVQRQEKVLDDYIRDKIGREIAMMRLIKFGMDEVEAENELSQIDEDSGQLGMGA